MAVLAIVGTVFASVFMAVEVSHDCIGDDCPICAAINIFRHISDALFMLTVSFAASAAFSDSGVSVCREGTVHINTPVLLKVKLLN